jgi:hypothetical protein
MAASGITLVNGTVPATPATGKTTMFADTSGVPHYVNDAGVDSTLVGPAGPTGPVGNSLARKRATLTSTAGSAVIDLSTGDEVYLITLTENTTISFTNLPAAGYDAEVRVRVTQHASAAKTCAFSGTSVKTAGGTWAASTTLSSVEDVGVAIDSAGNLTLYPSGLIV